MDYCKIDKNFNKIINEDIEINGKRYLGLNKMLEKINLNKMYPKHISPIHGDLSLENISTNLSSTVNFLIRSNVANCLRCHTIS